MRLLKCARRYEMYILLPVSVIPLGQQDLLCHFVRLLFRTEAKEAANTGICLLVGMGYTHASSCRHVKSKQLAIGIGDRNETNIVGKEIHVIVWRDSHSDFELQRNR